MTLFLRLFHLTGCDLLENTSIYLVDALACGSGNASQDTLQE